MNALIVIDIQKGYIENYEECLVEKINRRIQDKKKVSECIVYIKNTKCLRNGKRTEEFADSLSIVSDNIFEKEKADAFSNKEFVDFLLKNEIIHVELIGVDGNSCIAQSAIGATKLGFQVSLPVECVGVRNQERFLKTVKNLKEKGVFFMK